MLSTLFALAVGKSNANSRIAFQVGLQFFVWNTELVTIYLAPHPPTRWMHNDLKAAGSKGAVPLTEATGDMRPNLQQWPFYRSL